jgi:hypothetical protein
MALPVSVEPVKEMTGIVRVGDDRGADLLAEPVHQVDDAGGIPASSSTSTSSVEVCGTSSAGLRITLFPQTSAGNIFQVGIASGKLNGVMSPATPIGRR